LLNSLFFFFKNFDCDIGAASGADGTAGAFGFISDGSGMHALGRKMIGKSKNLERAARNADSATLAEIFIDNPF